MRVVEEFQALPSDGFRWLHLNLADQRTHDWLSNNSGLDGSLFEVLTTRDEQPRLSMAPHAIGIILPDFQRDFENPVAGGIGALHVAISSEVIITGRYHAVRTADLLRQRLIKNAPLDSISAVALLLDSMIGMFATTARELQVAIQTAEDDFLDFGPSSTTHALVSVRRHAAKLHRIVAGLRMVLHRLEHDPDTPADLQAVAEEFSQRASSVDIDIQAAQGHLRVLRDEFDLQATQRTNENLYFLSVMSALLLPATLVTGFFGMNTGGLPFARGPFGTAAAGCIALLASWLSWKVVRGRR